MKSAMISSVVAIYTCSALVLALSPAFGALSVVTTKRLTNLLGNAVSGVSFIEGIRAAGAAFTALLGMGTLLLIALMPMTGAFMELPEYFDTSVSHLVQVGLASAALVLWWRRRRQAGDVASDFSIVDRLVLYFFFWDLRWTWVLSHFGKRFVKLPSSVSESDENSRTIVFTIALARSGSSEVASLVAGQPGSDALRYGDLPFTLLPELLRRPMPTKNRAGKRIHLDHDAQSLRSVDAFDEPLIRAIDMLSDRENAMALLTQWYERLGSSLGCHRVIVKNNNHFKRLSLLSTMRNARFLVLLRHPLSTAQSLYRNHRHFCHIAEESAFFRDYLRMMRHTEFGPWHPRSEGVTAAETDSPDYWLRLWLVFARRVLTWLDAEASDYLLVSTDRRVSEQDAGAFLAVLEQGGANPGVALHGVAPLKEAPNINIEFSPELIAEALALYHDIHNRYGCV